MMRTTPTLLATLLLAGSAGIALAQDQSSPPTMAPPAMTPPTMTTNSPSLSSPSSNNGPASDAQLSQGQQPQEQSPPVQNKPNTSEDSWSQDLAAGGGRPGQPATADGSGQDMTPAQTQPAGTPAGRAHRQPVRRVAKSDPDGDRMTDALNILGSDGYVDIQSLTPQGGQFVANAVLNGRNVSVVVDPQTRQVTNRS